VKYGAFNFAGCVGAMLMGLILPEPMHSLMMFLAGMNFSCVIAFIYLASKKP
jgi:hypothetical protein